MPKQKLALNERGTDILDGRQMRAMAFVPAREQILDQVAARMSNRGSALVVGGGYSPVAASLRDRGYTTSGVDPSPAATALADGDGLGMASIPPTLTTGSTSVKLKWACSKKRPVGRPIW